jgi:hypothetical protein
MKIKDELERQREIEEIKETILQRAAAEKGNYNAMLAQTMPFGDGRRLKPLPNHAVGEVYKPAALNTHDPDNKYVWADENLPWWAWPLRLLGGLAFIAGIYSLVFLGMLL